MTNETNSFQEENKVEVKPVFTFDDGYRPLFTDSVNEQAAPEVSAISGEPVVATETVTQLPAETQPVVEVKEEKKKKTVGVGTCIAISSICTVIGCIIVAVLMICLYGIFDDGKDRNNNASLNNGIVDNGSDTTVSGEVIKPGSDVTINVETDNVANAVYAKANQSVVGIRVVTSTSYAPWANETYQIMGEGSGVVYSEYGIIVTNYHVISAALNSKGTMDSSCEIRVHLDTSLETYSKATLKGYDATTDLAVLKIDIKGLTPVDFADAEKVEIGETAIAIGSPGGLEFMNSVSSGIVSGLNRNLQTEDGIAYDLIQTTAAINPGNSGGALLNAEGELLGICVMKLVSTGYESMGFAISSGTVKSVVTQILKEGKVTRAALGVMISNDYDATEAAQYDLPVGAWVHSVNDGSAAEKGGIKKGDIIVGLDEFEISSFYDLRNALLEHKPGETIKVKVYRNGKYLTLTVVLDSQ
ncbi:MAG: PDZ domain-containing protein [Ruminococcaceae bacterium]|nr:PDZ domain-containing protein [Oscillospiraceae bacterium]